MNSKSEYMKKAKSVIIILSALCLFVTCVKKEKEYPTYYLGQEYRDYVVYKVGSYWIYEDSASKIIDSVYLFKQDIIMNDGNRKVNYNSEGLSENKYSSLYDTLIFGGGIPTERKGPVYNEIRLNDFIHINTNYFDGKIGEYNISTFYDSKRDSIIYINKFYNVKVFENKQQEYSYQPYKTYYAKHVGLVRKELFNGQVWNLIRYKVSQ